jgi:hypothetical protein
MQVGNNFSFEGTLLYLATYLWTYCDMYTNIYLYVYRCAQIRPTVPNTNLENMPRLLR